MNSDDLKIYIYTHKDFDVWTDNPIYEIINQNDNVVTNTALLQHNDNTLTNIKSDLSYSFCELKGLYWLWANHIANKSKYIGFCHYRRSFDLDLEHLENELDEARIIVASSFPSTIDFSLTKEHSDLDKHLLFQCIKKIYPDLWPTFEYNILHYNKLHLCNMFVMPSKYFDHYCSFIFNVLFMFANKLSITNDGSAKKHVSMRLIQGEYYHACTTINFNYDIDKIINYQSRIFGFYGERLTTLWAATFFGNKLIEKEIKNI